MLPFLIPVSLPSQLLETLEVGGRLDDGVRHPRRILALEDPGPHEHALGAQLHHQRRVRRGADAARDEVDDGPTETPRQSGVRVSVR